ncbi:putative disease resistance protein At3g14460 [Ziziphus jujuba]|uniref:Disease resistance protein At3g14460 n=1 Tax=Ziziphus jujuba TaxID=326968 RepID=A0ABM4A299_ZIZJJ|nr:putative disease resistance protein At3g14460 [Ziziphus jujuba]XP_060670858.1 putative disease resistance protein At3g14460 [Ziziphus jujuba]
MFVSGDSCFRLDDNVSKVVRKSTRHLSGLQCDLHYIKKFEDLCNKKILRTVILKKIYLSRDEYLMHILEQLQSMQYLRVLDVCGGFYNTEESPCMTKVLNSIANLKLLRHLRFDGTRIKEIPDSICNLYNLQTLILRNCGLTRLPDSIGNLKQLIYLDLYRSWIGKIPDSIGNLKHLGYMDLSWSPIEKMPDSIGNLEDLRYLDLSHSLIEKIPDTICNLHELQTLKLYSCYYLEHLPNSITTLINLCHLGKDSGSNIKELGELQHLQGRDLLIKGLENVINEEDASGAKLKDKKRITLLCLEWTSDSDDSQLARLPSLESVVIAGFNMMEKIGNEFYSDSDGSSSSSAITKPFKSLKSLEFSCMAEWMEWSVVEVEGNREEGGGVFSNLRKLELSNCPKLKGECLPDYLPCLETLSIRKSDRLATSLSGHQYPSLRVLRIWTCQKMKTFPEGSLPSDIQSIEIRECDELVSLLEE